MSKIKVLTVQYDVTHLTQEACDQLRLALEVQGEDIYVPSTDEEVDAELLNSAVREVEVEDL